MNAYRTETLHLSPFVECSVPKKNSHESIFLPKKDTKSLSVYDRENRLHEMPSNNAYVVLSQRHPTLDAVEKKLLSILVSKGSHIVLNGGSILDDELVLPKRHQLEMSIAQPCSLLLHLDKVPWTMAAPFVLKALMSLSPNSCLFLTLPSWCLPSFLLADIAYGLSANRLSIATGALFVPIFCSKSVLYQSQNIEIPFIEELERIVVEMVSSPSCGVAFSEETMSKSLFPSSQKEILVESLSRHISPKVYLRSMLATHVNAGLERIHEIERYLKTIEELFVSQEGVVSVGDVEEFLKNMLRII